MHLEKPRKIQHQCERPVTKLRCTADPPPASSVSPEASHENLAVPLPAIDENRSMAYRLARLRLQLQMLLAGDARNHYVVAWTGLVVSRLAEQRAQVNQGHSLPSPLNTLAPPVMD